MDRRTFMRIMAGTAAAGLPAYAQQRTVPVVGFLSSRSPEEAAGHAAAFRRGLSEAGYVDGKNVAIEYRWAKGRYERLPALARELVERKVTVLVAVGGAPSGLTAKAATSTTPFSTQCWSATRASCVASCTGGGAA